MSRRLAARSVPRITPAPIRNSRSLSSSRSFLQTANVPFYTIPRDNATARTPVGDVGIRKHLVGVPQRYDFKTPIHYSLVEDPNGWFLSSKSDQPEEGDIILFHPENNQQVVLNRHALRDACECDKCVDPHSGQKNFGTTDIPDDLPIQSCRRLEDASLDVVWQNDFISNGKPHQSTFPPSKVQSWFNNSREGFPALSPHRIWDKNIFEASPSTVKYDDWISHGPGFHAALAQLWNYGLVFVDGVPNSEESVVTLANQIGHVMETFYGRTWDVRSKPQAENVAYTSTFLGLHQDLLYTKDPPRIQLLHCLENTCEGGESIFSDAYRVARLMELGPEDLYQALLKKRIRYHYNKDGHFYQQQRRVLEHKGENVFWSPPFQDPDQPVTMSVTGSQHYSIWLKAAKTFRKLLEDEQWLYERKLKPGQCVIFDNLRVLHGRRKFDTTSGSRWLKGTYVSRDEWNSKVLTSSKEINEATKGVISSPLSQARKLNAWHKVWPSHEQPGFGRENTAWKNFVLD